MTGDRDKNYARFLLILCIICILYITILSRDRSLKRISFTDFFWSYKFLLRGHYERLTGLLQNIFLFIPLGYLLSFYLCDKQHFFISSFVISAALSLCIECIQYFTGCGWFDVDDLFNNTLGGLIGAVLFLVLLSGKRKMADMGAVIAAISILLAIVAFGYVRMKGSENRAHGYERQFYFDVISCNENSIAGVCKVYGRATPPYELYGLALDDPDGVPYKASTTIDGDSFIAQFPKAVNIEEKTEILIKFKHYDFMTHLLISETEKSVISPIMFLCLIFRN